MNELLRDLHSPSWWFSVVVAGVVVHMLASYLEARLDRWADGRSETRRARTAAEQKVRAEQIEVLRNDPSERLMLRLAAIDRLIRGVLVMLMSLIVTLNGIALNRAGSRVYFSFIGALFLLTSVIVLRDSASKMRLFNEATGSKELL